jgi:hypothetical protein
MDGLDVVAHHRPLLHMPIPPKKLFIPSPLVRIRLGALFHPSTWKLHLCELRVDGSRRGTPPTTGESDWYEDLDMRDLGRDELAV